LYSFFFQAEDGIRDRNVTGVQTCALPIFKGETIGYMIDNIDIFEEGMKSEIEAFENVVSSLIDGLKKLNSRRYLDVRREGSGKRSEERRVGKEWRARKG